MKNLELKKRAYFGITSLPRASNPAVISCPMCWLWVLKAASTAWSPILAVDTDLDRDDCGGGGGGGDSKTKKISMNIGVRYKSRTVIKNYKKHVKLENLWNKKTPNQLCWLTTHNKTNPRPVASAAPHPIMMAGCMSVSNNTNTHCCNRLLRHRRWAHYCNRQPRNRLPRHRRWHTTATAYRSIGVEHTIATAYRGIGVEHTAPSTHNLLRFGVGNLRQTLRHELLCRCCTIRSMVRGGVI